MTPRRVASSEDMTPILELLHRAFASMEGRIDPPSSLHRLTVDGIAEQARVGEVWVIDGQRLRVFDTQAGLHPASAVSWQSLLLIPIAQGPRSWAPDWLKLAEERARRAGFWTNNPSNPCRVDRKPCDVFQAGLPEKSRKALMMGMIGLRISRSPRM